MGCYSEPTALCSFSQWPQKPFSQLSFNLGMRLCLVLRAQAWLEVVGSACPLCLAFPSPPQLPSFLFSSHTPCVKQLLCFAPENGDGLIYFFRAGARLSLSHPRTQQRAHVYLRMYFSHIQRGAEQIKTHVHMFSFPDIFWKI